MEQQLVVFELAHENYGVDIAAVESILKMQTITAVPHAPEFVEGVTNLRGSVLPVIDLRKRLGLAASQASAHSRIVVVTIDNMKVGMIVDAVSEVLRVPAGAIEPTPPMVATVDTAFITGIAKLNGGEQDTKEQASRLVILLDLRKVLTLEEKAHLEAMPEPA